MVSMLAARRKAVMTKDVGQLIGSLLEVKEAWRSFFQEHSSVISTDILLALVHRYSNGNPLSMKQLVAELPHSEAAIKQHLRKLEQKELIVRQPSKLDGRVVHLIPCQSTIEATGRLAWEIRNIFYPPSPGSKK